MALRISIPMPATLVSDVLCAAIESGTAGAYWLRGFNSRAQRRHDFEYTALHIGAMLRDDDGKPATEYDEPVKHSRIGAARIAHALELMFTKGNTSHAERAGRVLSGNFDAPDADVVLQFAAFEEVVYG